MKRAPMKFILLILNSHSALHMDINTNDTNEHRLMRGNDSQGTHLQVYQKARQSP